MAAPAAGATAAAGADAPGGRRGLTYQPAVDGMRGLAVLAVLLFHAGHLQGGFLGVDLFFTVSGYLITSLLLAERDRAGRIDLPSFWGRRARRLLPALFVLIAAVLAVYAVWGAPGQAEQLRGPGLGGLFYVANWQAIAGDGYWALFSSPSPFEHLWSLAIEEQFYLLWPFVVVLLLARARNGPRAIAVAAGVAAAVSALLMAVYARGDLERAYLGTDSRIGSILLGAVVAVLLRDDRSLAPAPRRAISAAAWAGAAALAALWIAVDGDDSLLYRGGFTFHALAVAVIIVAVTVDPGAALGRALSWRPLVAVGLVSYGLYLWHWPVFVWMNPDRMGFSGWGLTAVRFAVAGGLAYASYRLIERPIRRGGLVPRLAIPLAVASAAALAVALVVVSRPPDPEDLVTGEALAPTGAVTTVATATTVVPSTATVTVASSAAGAATSAATIATTTTTRPTTIATTPPTTAGPTLSPLVRIVPAAPAPLRHPTPDDPLRVVLFGDSYMYDAAPGIEAALEATGLVQVDDRAVLGFGLAKDDWRQHVEDAVDGAPDLIVTMWARFDVGLIEEKGAGEFAGRLQEAMAILLSGGAQLLVVGLAPSELGFGRHDLVSRGINDVFAALPAAFPGRVTYLDPDPLVAPDGVPTLTIPVEGGVLRVRKVDMGHYCPDGSARFGQALVEVVGVAAGVPPPTAPWYAGPWRQDDRYDDPPGACR